MRPALLLAAAVSLAACRVDVEGAPCDQPGAAEQCPSGQACGVDGRCSERAASCTRAEQRCAPGADTRCSPGATHIETCTDADPCGAWALVDAGAHDCSARRLVCEAANGTASCACAQAAGELLVDAASPPGSVAPTGAAEPPECRFKTLGAALAYAADVWQPANGGGAVVVRARGTPAPGAPVVFAAESLPLVVAPGVTLAAGGEAAADWVIAASPPGDGDVVQLHGGGVLEGFTIRGAAPGTGRGISIRCASGADAVVTRVTVDGGSALSRGVSVTGPCGLAATDLRVSNVAGPGVVVDAALADAAVPSVGARLDSAWIEDCAGSGIDVRGGALTLNGTVARRNGGFGVKAVTRDDLPRRAIALDLNDSTFEENGEAGLGVLALEAGSSLQVRRSTFTRNKASTAQETEFRTGRRAGGVFLNSAPPAVVVFEGNQIYANANPAGFVVDQLVTLSGSPWNLSAPACGASGNVFACPGNGYFAYASGGSLKLENAYWPPGLGWPAAALIANTDVVPPCDMDPAPIPACPQ